MQQNPLPVSTGESFVVNKKMLIDAIGLLLMALVAVVVGYKLSPLDAQGRPERRPDPACNLHRNACSAELPGEAAYEFSLAPRPIPMVKAAGGRGDGERTPGCPSASISPGCR